MSDDEGIREHSLNEPRSSLPVGATASHPQIDMWSSRLSTVLVIYFDLIVVTIYVGLSFRKNMAIFRKRDYLIRMAKSKSPYHAICLTLFVHRVKGDKWVKVYVVLQDNHLFFYNDHKTKDHVSRPLLLTPPTNLFYSFSLVLNH